jgi:hypothetical protein
MKEDIHWKREQDEYFGQIGAMPKIKQDPMARLGYEVRSDNPYRVVNMDSVMDRMPFEYYGLYNFRPDPDNLDSREPRSNGTVSVDTGLPPDRYAKTTVHELGHVGSRNSQSDREYIAGVQSGEEEKRRRFRDYLMWPPGHPGHEDAKRHLQTTYNMPDDYDEKAKEFGREVGLIESTDKDKKKKKKSPPPKPRPKPEQSKKKKKTLIDFFR